MFKINNFEFILKSNIDNKTKINEYFNEIIN